MKILHLIFSFLTAALNTRSLTKSGKHTWSPESSSINRQIGIGGRVLGSLVERVSGSQSCGVSLVAESVCRHEVSVELLAKLLVQKLAGTS